VNLSRKKRAVIPALAGALLGAMVAYAPASSAAPRGMIPEYYQFCYDNPPFASDGYSSTYKTAIARPGGVECQHYTSYEGIVFGWPWRTYYNWSTVCRGMGLPTPGWWDGRYPRCG
jgi:hypothetical protein